MRTAVEAEIDCPGLRKHWMVSAPGAGEKQPPIRVAPSMTSIALRLLRPVVPVGKVTSMRLLPPVASPPVAEVVKLTAYCVRPPAAAVGCVMATPTPVTGWLATTPYGAESAGGSAVAETFTRYVSAGVAGLTTPLMSGRTTVAAGIVTLGLRKHWTLSAPAVGEKQPPTRS